MDGRLQEQGENISMPRPIVPPKRERAGHSTLLGVASLAVAYMEASLLLRFLREGNDYTGFKVSGWVAPLGLGVFVLSAFMIARSTQRFARVSHKGLRLLWFVSLLSHLAVVLFSGLVLVFALLFFAVMSSSR